MRRAWWTVLIAALLTGIVAAPASGEPAQTRFEQDCAHLGDSTAPDSLAADARPVVLIHDAMSAPSSMQPIEAALQAAAPGLYSFAYFDYHNVNTSWPTEDSIAACFASYLGWVSDTYKGSGGDGRVLLIGHGTGGLVPRYAVSPEIAGEYALSADDAAGLITINTPHTGTTWPATLGSLADADQLGAVPDSLPNDPASSAVACLAAHGPDTPLPADCPAAPYLPAEVQLAEISSEITLAPRFLDWDLAPITLGSDGLVPAASQRGYTGSYGSGADAQNVPNAASIITAPENTIACTVEAAAVTTGLATADADPTLLGMFAQNLGHYTQPADDPTDPTDPGDPADAASVNDVLALLSEASAAATCGHATTLTNQATHTAITTTLDTMVNNLAHTDVRYIEPVDADGDPAPGWEGSPGVDFGASGLCSGASEVSVSDNVTDCGLPGLDACWPVKANPHFLRCALPLTPSPAGEVKGSSVLVYTDTAPGSIGASADATPWFLELTGQVRCSRLLTGAPPELPSSLSAWYACNDGTYVVGDSATSPINKDHPQWTVDTVQEGGVGTPVQVEVIAAYAAKTAPDAEPSMWSFKTTGFGAVAPGMTIANAKSATSGVFSVGPDEESISPQCVTNTFTYIGGDPYTIDNPLTGFVSYGEFSFLTQTSKATGKIVAIYNVFNSPTHAPTSRWILPGTSTVGELKAAYSDFNLSWATSSSDAYTRQVAITQDGPGGLGATATSDEADGKAPDSSFIAEIGVGADATKVFDEGGGC